MTATITQTSPSLLNLVREDLLSLSDEDLLRATMAIYSIPSLAAWRAAELKVLRHLHYQSPVLEIGCGSGSFSSLLLSRVEWGIDLNPREVVNCRNNKTHQNVSRMDARNLLFAGESFQTVFANCVIEHIPELDRALMEFHRVLRSGGRMITTVPTEELNLGLLLGNPGYARLRARQLQHLNLWTREGWESAFRAAGFSEVRLTPYLPLAFGRAWDRVDGPMSLALGPLRISRLYKALMLALPDSLRRKANTMWLRYFLRALAEPADVSPVAFLIEAVK
jgi:SAM-dependent methyltransferase